MSFIVEYIFRDRSNDELWIDIKVDGLQYMQLGPWCTEEERQRVLDDLTDHTRQLGAIDLPLVRQ